MIQLATGPNARNTWRAAAADGKDDALAPRRARSGHAWPFISRTTERPAASQEPKRTPSTGS